MKTKLSNILIGLQAAAALCVIGAVKLWAPVCGKMLTLETGKEVPMRCFYTGQAAIAIAVVMLAIAAVALLTKSGHRKLMIVSSVAAALPTAHNRGRSFVILHKNPPATPPLMGQI